MPLVTRTISQLTAAAEPDADDIFLLGRAGGGPARGVSYTALLAALAAEGIGGEAADVAVAARVLAQEAAEAAEAEAAAADAARVLAEAALAAALTVTGVVVPIMPTLASFAETSPGVGGQIVPAGVNALQVTLRAPNYAIPATLRGKPYMMARMSKADIDAADCYPDRAFCRSADRFMPDLSTDAVNGGYWVIAEPVIEAEMFGQLHLNATETTATLRAFHEMSYWAHRPGDWTGDDYVVNGPLLAIADLDGRAGGLKITRRGRVKVAVAGGSAPMVAVIYALAGLASDLTLDGDPLEIDGNALARYGVFAGHKSATMGGRCRVRGITGRNLLAGAGEGAAAVYLTGGFSDYDGAVEDCYGHDINRAPNGLLTGGECKAVSINDAVVAVTMRRCGGTNIHAQDDRDGDILSIFGGLDEDGVPLCPLAIFEDCTGTDGEGRSVKIQAARGVLRRCRFSRSSSIGNGVDIDCQWGALDLDDVELTVTGAVGASYSAVAIQAAQPLPGVIRSRVKGLTINSSVLLPRGIFLGRGAASPAHEVVIEGLRGRRTDNAALPLFDRGAIEFNAAQVKASATKLTIVADSDLPNDRPVVCYTAHDGSDLSAKLALVLDGNRTTISPESNSRLFNASSGSEITLLTDYVLGVNEGYHKGPLGTWTVNLATLRPGNDFTIELSTATITNGPSNLPASGKLHIVVGGGETAWIAERDRVLRWNDGARTWRTLGGIWVETSDRPIIEATATFDPASLALGAAGSIQTITVTGAALGDFARASFSNDLAGVIFHAWVSAANTVSYLAFNAGGTNPRDLASGTVKIRVEK